MKFTLPFSVCNYIVSILTTVTPPTTASKINAVTIIDHFNEVVRSYGKDENNNGIPDTLEVILKKSHLDSIWLFFKEYIKSESSNTTEIINIKNVCNMLKMSSRYMGYVKDMVDEVAEALDD